MDWPAHHLTGPGTTHPFRYRAGRGARDAGSRRRLRTRSRCRHRCTARPAVLNAVSLLYRPACRSAPCCTFPFWGWPLQDLRVLTWQPARASPALFWTSARQRYLPRAPARQFHTAQPPRCGHICQVAAVWRGAVLEQPTLNEQAGRGDALRMPALLPRLTSLLGSPPISDTLYSVARSPAYLLPLPRTAPSTNAKRRHDDNA